MCGINGIVRLTADAPPVSREELLKTRDAMASRGPDGSGLWTSADCGVGIGHRRLAIIDLSEGGAQPMTSADGRYVIVYNGEIYNYRELRSDLEREGIACRSQSDTEVLLALFARHGADMLPKLRGMYAFAVWDEKERSLFLARDPYGIKPLYYSADGGVFRFASQVKALQAGRRLSGKIDPAGVVGFLLWGSVPEPLTLFPEIRALPAGKWAEVRNGRFAVHAWERVEPLGVAGDRRSPTVAGALEDSVRAHLVSDVPVGIFLSAGLDSALLLALACRHLPRPPTTFTLTFDEFRGTAVDEGPGAAEVANQFGAPHVEWCVTRAAFDDLWPDAVNAMDQPTIDGLNVYLISHFAREAGLKVVLSGLGGDEVFGSYPSFADVPRWHRWVSRGVGFPGVNPLWSRLGPMMAARWPKAAGLLRYGTTIAGTYFLRRGLYLPEELTGVVDPEIARDGLAAYDPVADAARVLFTGDDDWTSVHFLESRLYMRNQLLRDADWASMAHSLELRVPFVDIPLRVAAAAAHFEPARSHGKVAVAREAAPELPERTLGRFKSGFMIPGWKPPRPTASPQAWGLQSRARALEVLKHFGVPVLSAPPVR